MTTPPTTDDAAPTAATRTGQLAALAALDGLGGRRLGALLGVATPDELLAALADGAGPAGALGLTRDRDELAHWTRQLAEHPLASWRTWCARLGVRAVTIDEPEYPAALRLDERPPPILFVQGSIPGAAPSVAVVGTRNASTGGRTYARRLGRELADAGVTVVSGLARGIDAEAHHGALAASQPVTIGVVANGHDRPYPRQNAALWRDVAGRGAVLGEWPPGTSPDAFRFPLRNRIVAALADVVIVVESRETGGSLITAMLAAERGVTVMAVPGDPRARVSRGTNELIRDGAVPVTSVDDVFAALSLSARPSATRTVDPRPRPRGVEAAVFARVGEVPCTLDQLVTELDLTVSAAAMAVARLERTGWLCERDGWFEVVAHDHEVAR